MSVKITSTNTKTGKETITIIKGNKVKGFVIKDGQVYKDLYLTILFIRLKSLLVSLLSNLL